jgi:hypothetical protein
VNGARDFIELSRSCNDAVTLPVVQSPPMRSAEADVFQRGGGAGLVKRRVLVGQPVGVGLAALFFAAASGANNRRDCRENGSKANGRRSPLGERIKEICLNGPAQIPLLKGSNRMVARESTVSERRGKTRRESREGRRFNEWIV